jgi:hypothetical protein
LSRSAVPVGNLIWLEAANRVNRPPDDRGLQTDLVCAGRVFPTAGRAGSRDHGAASSAERAAAEIAEAVDLQQVRSADIRWIVWFGTQRAECLGNC